MNIRIFFFTVMLLALFTGCSSFSDDSNPYEVNEATKNMSGTWKLQTVTRNGVDITNTMDFTRFQLNLKADGTYNIQNYLPFVVSGEGTWSVNDPHHPMMLSFQEKGAANAVNLDFNYPIVDGKRSISITLSPGCHSNVYVYTLYCETDK